MSKFEDFDTDSYGSSWPSEDGVSTPMEILDLPEDIRLEIDAIIERNDCLETQMGAFDMRLLGKVCSWFNLLIYSF